jgi:hypothetical protein
MAPQTRITLEVAMRVRDVSRPPVARASDAASDPAGSPGGASGAEAAKAPEAQKTPPLSRKGERRRLRMLRKRGEGGQS